MKMNRFNKNISRKNTNCVKWDMIEGDKSKVVPFSIADSDYPTAKEIVRCIKKRAKHPIYGYSYPVESYYESIINWTARRYNYTIDKDNIIPTNGVVTSLYYAIKHFGKNTESVIIQPPVYNPFYSVILDNDKQVLKNRLLKENNYYTMDYDDLEKHLKSGSKMIIICSPQNPTGRVFTYDELKRVVDLAKKYDAFILSDEIHCDIMLEGNEFVSLNKFADEYNKIIVFTSISKSFGLAGLKTSNVIIKDKKLADSFREFLSHNYISFGNVFGLTAVKSAYNHAEKWLDKQNIHLTQNFKYLKNYLQSNYPKVGITKSEGTFLAWLDLSYLGMSCVKMRESLKEFGIIINEGRRYDEDCKGYIRFNFACSRKQLKLGLEVLGQFLNQFEN